jgi:tetratricopeptide (TPR) repeat protein
VPAAVIGRERELDALSAAATDAAAGRGRVVFLSGPTGSGKSALVRAASERITAAEADADVVTALCYDTNAGNPLAPFGEILRALTSRERRGDRAKRVIELVGQVAPPLVELIPVIGKLAAVGVKAASDLGVYALGGNHDARQAELAADMVAALRRIAEDEPLVLVIDDAQWIDGPSCEVIDRLANGIEEQALAVVLAYDPASVQGTHPLGRLRAKTLVLPGVLDLTLENLGAAEIDGILIERYGALPARRLGAWLHDRTDGSPLFLEQYLITLEQQGLLHQVDGQWALDGKIDGVPGSWVLRGRLADAETPGSLLALLGPRLAELASDERALLETGSLQGRRFLSIVLAQILDESPDAIFDRLSPLVDRQMIAFEDVEDWWTGRSDLVSFEPAILQELLYGRFAKSPFERGRRHKAVAEALDALIANDDPPPRHALLEIARHYEEASEPLNAAARLVAVAESTFAEGADRETATHAGRALELLRGEGARDGSVEGERLFAKAALLLLLGGEPSWRADTGGSERLLTLADEAERAAAKCGDPRLRANARYATALVSVAYRGLDAGVAAYREALALAREADDAVAAFAILHRLGHLLDSVDLHEGSAVLQEAHVLLTSGRLADRLDAAALELESARLESALGVAAFDLGRYGEADELLGRSARTLRATRRDDDYAWALAFLGQLQTAVGHWEAAEETLREAIAVFDEDERDLGIRGYLRALVGRLDVEREPQRLEDARRELAAGRAETHAARYVSVQPLVDAHWAELLLAEGTEAGRREADEVLASSPTFGWARSEIAIGSLRARIALEEGRHDDAMALSGAAYGLLCDRKGAVPTVRSEEIVFVRGTVLAAVGSSESADRFAEAARILRKKAELVTDPAQRDSLLQRVRLSREILAAAP